MSSSGMLIRAALVRTDVSEEHIASIIRVTEIGKLGTKLAVTSNRSTSVLTGATRHSIREDGNLHSHRGENLESYIALTGWFL
jgi:hypothetical protein